MNAQMIIDCCENNKFNPKQFRDEINISNLIQEAIKSYKKQA